MTDTHFESEKNFRASMYTLLVVTLIMLIFFYSKWTLPVVQPPALTEGIEVNLGNSEEGFGEDQALSPGAPAPSEQVQQQPPAATTPVNEEKDILTNDKDEDAPEIKKPPVIKPTPKPVLKDITSTPPIKPKKTPIAEAPVVSAPRPKAVFKGVSGNGAGGIDADAYKKGGNQGVAGGNGDQGKPGGDPDSKNYSGGGQGSGAVTIKSGLGGRSITGTPSFKDDFNENGKVAVDIRVDESGTVISATYQPRGSTTSDASMKAIALSKAKKVKFSGASEESSGTIVFTFRVTN